MISPLDHIEPVAAAKHMERLQESLNHPPGRLVKATAPNPDTTSLASIAISLKRIADRLDDIASGEAALTVRPQ
jgi:hypothetical protein